MGSIGMPELIVILLIVMVVFGAGKLPQIGENLGKAIRNYKKSSQDVRTRRIPEEFERRLD